MTTPWIIAAVIIGGLVCFFLLCKGRTPIIEEKRIIITDELPGDCIDLFNYPAYQDGVEVDYAPKCLKIKYSKDRYAGLIVYEFELIYLVGPDANEKMPDKCRLCSIVRANVGNSIKGDLAKIGLVKAYYDFKSKVLCLDWGIV